MGRKVFDVLPGVRNDAVISQPHSKSEPIVERRIVALEGITLEFIPSVSVLAPDRPAECIPFEMGAVIVNVEIVGRDDPLLSASPAR